MAIFTAGPASTGFDITKFDPGLMLANSGVSVVRNSTLWQVEAAGVTYRMTGTYLLDGQGQAIAGPMSGYEELRNGESLFSIQGISGVTLGLFAEYILDDFGIGLAAYFFGNSDQITGSNFNDVLFGLQGHDLMRGLGGKDNLYGGAGNDTIEGGEGESYLRGDDGNDRVVGGSAFDDINGNVGEDTAFGGLGGDWVVGGKDNDLLSGDDGDDIVYGNIGADWCDGGVGNDVVRGGQDNDNLLGQAGDDWLSGDKGDDTISGGAGADIFHTFGDAGLDRVTDFNRAQGDRVMVDPGTAYTVAQQGADVVVTMTGGGRLVLVGVQQSTLTDGWIFGA